MHSSTTSRFLHDLVVHVWCVQICSSTYKFYTSVCLYAHAKCELWQRGALSLDGGPSLSLHTELNAPSHTCMLLTCSLPADLPIRVQQATSSTPSLSSTTTATAVRYSYAHNIRTYAPSLRERFLVSCACVETSIDLKMKTCCLRTVSAASSFVSVLMYVHTDADAQTGRYRCAYRGGRRVGYVLVRHSATCPANAETSTRILHGLAYVEIST